MKKTVRLTSFEGLGQNRTVSSADVWLVTNLRRKPVAMAPSLYGLHGLKAVRVINSPNFSAWRESVVANPSKLSLFTQDGRPDQTYTWSLYVGDLNVTRENAERALAWMLRNNPYRVFSSRSVFRFKWRPRKAAFVLTPISFGSKDQAIGDAIQDFVLSFEDMGELDDMLKSGPVPIPYPVHSMGCLVGPSEGGEKIEFRMEPVLERDADGKITFAAMTLLPKDELTPPPKSE